MDETITKKSLQSTVCNKCGKERVPVKWCPDCKVVVRQAKEQFGIEKCCSKCGRTMISAEYCPDCKTVVKKKTDSGERIICGYMRCKERITLISAYKNMFKNYANFSGRCRRKEYWLAGVANGIVSTIYGFLLFIISCLLIDQAIALAIFMTIFLIVGIGYSMAAIIPSLSISVRRLHDVGYSGWTMLLGLIPFVGSIILLVFSCLEVLLL